MRKPKFLSPSSKARWESNRTGFYLKYLADHKTEREPQAPYMGVGSGFDAHVKSAIMTRAMGKPLIAGSSYEFEALFEAQVEHHHRDRSLKISTEIWKSYIKSGAFEVLWNDIERSPFAPMMEDRVEGIVGGVPLLGLPDLVYIDWGQKIIADFKILGSTSAAGGGASPPQGYKIVRDGWDGKPSNTHNKAHKKHVSFSLPNSETTIGKAYMEDLNMDWADQMSTYAWLLGSKVGSEDFIVRIECGACRHPKQGMRVKWSTHMNRVSATHQLKLIKEYQAIWEAIESEHIFQDMSKEDSIRRCGVLELQAASPNNIHAPLRNMGQDTTNFWMRTR